MKKLEKLGAPDVVLLGITLTLLTIGLLLVFDSSYARMADSSWTNNDPWYEAKRQLVYAAVGLLLMLLAARTRLQTLLKLTVPLLVLSVLLLGAVFVVGTEVNGAHRWIRVGPVQFQPSEIAKIALVLYLAGVLAQRKMRVQRLTSGWFAPAAVVATVFALIVLEPDLGTGLVIVFVSFVMLFAAGAKLEHLVGLAGAGAAMAWLAVKLEPYRMDRILTWRNPWRDPYGDGYQMIHSLIALGTGGLTGVGLCEGREKLYQPATSTDFIFATLGEELGLIGCLVLLTLFVLFTVRGFGIGRKCKSSYANLVAVGITSLISLQALTNVLVVSGSIPATGIPLPLISYGGSSLVSMLVGVGILLAVSRQTGVSLDDREIYENSFDGWRDRRTYLPRNQRRTSTSGGGTRRRAAVRR